jgi:uncharacterized membrane protein
MTRHGKPVQENAVARKNQQNSPSTFSFVFINCLIKYSAMADPSQAALEQQIARLTQRVYRLEELLRRHGLVTEQIIEQPAPAPIPAATQTAPAPQPSPAPAQPPPSPIAPPAFLTQQPQAPDRSLESRIGSQWFNRIGILAVLIGMAWFLKFAIDNHWIGPAGRVLIGIVAGAGLIAWSERFRARGFAAFSYSLKAIGSGILYLSLWAAFSLFNLIPSSVAFLAMLLVTAFNGFMAWSQESELLALYAIVGGYSTPLLLANGENHEIALFSYLLLLNVATLILISLRPWSRLLLGSFVGSVFFFISWSWRFYADSEFGVTAFFLAVFFLVFAFAPHLVRLNQEITADLMATRDAIALLILPLANAALGFLGFYLLVNYGGSSSASPWIAVAFAAFYLLLIRVSNLPESMIPPALKSLDLVIAVVFLIIAIPLKTHGRWLTIGWLVEGAALLYLTRFVPQRLLRGLALIALALGLCALILINPPASATILFNERFGTYLAAIAVFAFTAWFAIRSSQSGEDTFPFSWRITAGTSVIIVNLLILIAVSLEIHSYWAGLRSSGGFGTYYGRGLSYGYNYRMYETYSMYEQFSYSAFFMLFGAILLILGFLRNSAFLRWQALVLLAFAIAKVFLIDISQLSQGYRILSFLGLGALLLCISFAYQRDWLNLRGSQHQSQ